MVCSGRCRYFENRNLQRRRPHYVAHFISGSPTGLGLMAADLLVSKGHSVVLQARNAERAEEAERTLTMLW